MKTQHQGGKRDEACAAPEQSPRGNRDDQDKKKIEQLPPAHPAIGRTIDTGGTQEFMSRWQIQRRLYTRETRIPACDRHAAARSGSTERFNTDVGLPDFNTGLAFALTCRDKQVFSVFGRAQQRVRTRHVQTPVGPHRAFDQVLDDESAAIKVEPHRTA